MVDLAPAQDVMSETIEPNGVVVAMATGAALGLGAWPAEPQPTRAVAQRAARHSLEVGFNRNSLLGIILNKKVARRRRMANAACQDGTVTLWLPRGYRAESEFEVKRSRFLTTLARVDAEEAAREVIADVRRVHPAARHHCSAFIVEVEGAQHIERSSDDGEPSGTAGAPMLGVLRGSGVTQVVAVVTRYFGGVLLGTGGLVRAYSDAVAEALAVAPKMQLVVATRYRLVVAAADAGGLEQELRRRGATLVSSTYGPQVELEVLSVIDVELVARRITRGRCVVHSVGPVVVEVVR